MLILIGVVTDAALAGEQLQLLFRQGRLFRQAQRNHLERVERPAQVAVAEHREAGEHPVIGGVPAGTQPALRIQQGLPQHAGHFGG